MSQFRKLLPVLIACSLGTGSAIAQDACEELEGSPPGLYATTDEGRTFLVKDGEVVELGPGEAGFADETGVRCIQRTPQFLDWPCSTDAARSRMFRTYSVDELEGNNKALEIVQRYFEVPEVIEPIPRWKEGEYHLRMSVDDILQFRSEEYWYFTAPEREPLDKKRPKTLLIALYVGINQVVVDGPQLKALAEYYGSEDIPVVFDFNDSNVVPISYFGPNVSLEELLKANTDRGINIDQPPMWELGDHNIRPSVSEMETFFDIPALEDIPPERVEALRADLEQYGFSTKPIFVSIFSGSNTMVVDQPQRVRVAAEMGYNRIPVQATIIQSDIVVQRCGPGTPAGFGNVSISGESTPPGGAALPPASSGTPPAAPYDPTSGTLAPPAPPTPVSPS